MKRGRSADGVRFQQGLDAVRAAYGNKGFLEASFSADQVPAVDGPQVTYIIKIDGGSRYGMGSVEITGFPDRVASRIRSQWNLPPGELFDASYPGRFRKASLIRKLAMDHDVTLVISHNLDRVRHMVDVSIRVGSEAKPQP